MSNAQWTKTTYQPPTEITRNGVKLYFCMSQQEMAMYGKPKIIMALKNNGLKYRFIYTRNAEYELWLYQDIDWRTIKGLYAPEVK